MRQANADIRLSLSHLHPGHPSAPKTGRIHHTSPHGFIIRCASLNCNMNCANFLRFFSNILSVFCVNMRFRTRVPDSFCQKNKRDRIFPVSCCFNCCCWHLPHFRHLQPPQNGCGIFSLPPALRLRTPRLYSVYPRSMQSRLRAADLPVPAPLR